jgi:hypothetical protein
MKVVSEFSWGRKMEGTMDSEFTKAPTSYGTRMASSKRIIFQKARFHQRIENGARMARSKGIIFSKTVPKCPKRRRGYEGNFFQS